ncbi:hypothetical protein MKEN_00759900 [Mycena kentingensis (nom. inval.)]|nr:hypothetical protein MKEN_00759900 [Mycena kentingensis (nom. inval.)]
MPLSNRSTTVPSSSKPKSLRLHLASTFRSSQTCSGRTSQKTFRSFLCCLLARNCRSNSEYILQTIDVMDHWQWQPTQHSADSLLLPEKFSMNTATLTGTALLNHSFSCRNIHLGHVFSPSPLALDSRSSTMALSTRNALTQSERSRLVRSNRKLQALLGAAPQIIEAAVSEASSPASPNRGRAPGQVSKHKTSQSVGNTALFSPAFDMEAFPLPPSANSNRPQLYLRVDSNSPLHPETLSPPLTPLSPTSSITLNSFRPSASPSPPPTVSRSASTKRRRELAAKLSRTLGENVAPDMLPPVAFQAPRGLRRSASAVSVVEGRRNSQPTSKEDKPAAKAVTIGRSRSTYARSRTDNDDGSFVLVYTPTTPDPAVSPFLFPASPLPAVAESPRPVKQQPKASASPKPRNKSKTPPPSAIKTGLQRSFSTHVPRSPTTPTHRRFESAAPAPRQAYGHALPPTPALEAAWQRDRDRESLAFASMIAGLKAKQEARARAAEVYADVVPALDPPSPSPSPSDSGDSTPLTPPAIGYTVPTTQDLASGKRRKEKEWSGEWNVAMQKVKKELRALR